MSRAQAAKQKSRKAKVGAGVAAQRAGGAVRAGQAPGSKARMSRAQAAKQKPRKAKVAARQQQALAAHL